MLLDSLNIENLRSINKLKMTFQPGINLIYGKNGRGKTSILEAIYILSISRSFRSHFLKNIISNGKNKIKVIGKIKDTSNQHLKIEYYKHEKQKRIKINEKKINNLSELLGVFPVTVLSPEDIDIIIGSIKDKHRFFNTILCHTNKLYLNHLQKYKHTIKQRNALLKTNPNLDVLQIWNLKLSELGEKIWLTRKIFFKDFSKIFNNLWNQINCEFHAEILFDTNQVLSQKDYYDQLCNKHLEDIRIGHTTKGPHKDAVELFFNQMPIKNCGSQGEKKLFLIVLKIAEAIYINQSINKEPIILLDDLFAMLDKKRGSEILKLLTNDFQTFITTTDANAETYFENMKTLNFIKLEECDNICFAA